MNGGFRAKCSEILPEARMGFHKKRKREYICLETYLENNKNSRHMKKTKVVDNCVKIHCTDFLNFPSTPLSKKHLTLFNLKLIGQVLKVTQIIFDYLLF